MKLKNINRVFFNRIVESATKAMPRETTAHIFKKYAIGAIIDECHHNGSVVVFNGDVFTVEHNDRTGDLWNVLWDIIAETPGEWAARVELGLLP